MSNREIFIDKLRQLSKEEMLERYIALLNTEKLTDYVADLEAKLAESENKLNQYPYKNDVIEEQYEDLKDAITFLMLNNIKDQEQLNYSIDILCAKHKARIRDIENGICSIEELKQQLAEKEKEIECLRTRQFIDMTEKEMLELKIATHNEDLKKIKHIFDQDKISFAVEQLEKVKEFYTTPIYDRENPHTEVRVLLQRIDNQIKQLKEMM